MPLSSQLIDLDSLAALASQMSDGVCLLSADGHIQYANVALRAMLGLAEPEILGRRIGEFRQIIKTLPDGAHGEVRAAPWAVSERVTVCEWRRGDGGVFEARCVLTPLADRGERGGSILLITPIARVESGAERSENVHQAQREERALLGRWVEVIEAVTDVTLSRLPPTDMIEAMLKRIQPALDLENAAVFLINDEGSALVARVVVGAGCNFGRALQMPLREKIISGVMRSRKPVVVNGASELMQESGLFPESLLESMIVHSMLLAPLIVEERTIGLLYLGAREPDHFTDDDIRLARLAGSRLALAVVGARMREEAARSQWRMMTLAEASETLVGPLNHEQIAERLVSLVAPALTDACALYLVEEDGAIRQAAVSGLAAEGAPTQEAVAQALQLMPQELERFDQAPDELAPEMKKGRRKSGSPQVEPVTVTWVPVEAHRHVVGALYLIGRAGRRLAPEDLTLIQELASRAAIGMEIARLYADLEQALRRVSESAIQLDTIFDSTDAGIYVANAAGHFTRINTYGARMLGLSETMSHPARDKARAVYELRDERGNLIPPEEEPLFIARSRNVPVEQRVIIHRFDTGADIPTLARCTPMRNGQGEVIGAVCALMDITGINELERQKDEFLGIVSHELKTPLTTLKILSQMLARRMRASDEPRAQEQAERMTTAIIRMERLINDLLDVTRIQEGKMTLTLAVCDLGAICRDALREQEIINQRPIHLSLPDRESLPIHADTERLRQVVVNLLSNALKYSPANMPVTLRVREAGGQYLVSVEDHGPGLPPDERRRLFHRFYRAPSVQVQSGSGVGLGLGLFISREIVLNHGGKIWVESEPGHGSVFTFSIPRAGRSDGED